MTVLVHFSGPSFSKSVVLEPAAPPLDVGRDAQAGVHLPDIDRLISRRHFTLEWDQAGAKVTVLSKVNGITTTRGEFNQGQSVVLAPGESGALGSFTFLVAAPAAPAAPEPAAKSADPWADFASEWVPPGSKKEKPAAFPPSSQVSLNRAYDDAFSSSTAWHVGELPDTVLDPLSSASFQTDQVLNAAFSVPPQAAPAGADAQASATALQALCKGLGLAGPRQLSDAEWEHLGRSIRQVVQGLVDVANVRADLKREMRAADRTMLGPQENNPLKGGMPLDELLHYLLFMPQGAAGNMPVPQALEEFVADLRAHELASLAAVEAVVEGTLQEFEPGKLRDTLLKGKRSIAAAIDNARLWDLYTTHYGSKGQHMADWLAQMFDRHFMPAYLREAERLRREAQAQRPPVRRA